ncbi:ABC transporter substrate-binding protein [Mesobacillus jeotgali]|uniref:ABC transporter substrate-binding protein n=1 Tax=Mesobacillus jeotgali TaxID=129985 RepID=UPI00178226F4|nr:extracellular solute-binding protein [Mesobacillus jeotgali]UYZ21780.1 extracellular solute-binding protein [Mesobacillus jeotgali]
MFKKTAILAIALMMLLVTGCGNSNKENESGSGSAGEKQTVTMGFWGAAEDLKLYKDAAAKINEVNKDFQLEIKQYPSSEQFWDTLPAEIAAGVAPDFIKVSNEGAYEYISKGLFTPLDEFIGSEELDMSVFNENVVDVWKVDDKQYGIPNTMNAAMFFINEDMWKEAGLGEYPTTWDEVYEAAEKLTKDEVSGIGINLHPYHITNYLKSYGGGWNYGENIDSEENVKALDFVLKMYEEDLAVTPKELGLGWDGEVFANEKAAMTTGGYWYKAFLKDANPDLKYAVLPIPEGTEKGSSMISDAYVLLKDSKNKEAAVQAAYKLTSEEVQQQFMAIGHNPSRTALSEQYFKENPEFKEIEKALEYSTDWEYPDNTKMFTDKLAEELEAKVLGGNDKSAKDILESIQQSVK